MAVWDHQYKILPRKKIEEAYGSVPEEMSQEDVFRDGWWAGESLPTDEEMEAILPVKTSIIVQTKLWGTDLNDKIEIGFDENRNVTDMNFQVDLRNEFPFLRDLIYSIAALAKRYQWIFVENSGEEPMKVVMPEYDQIAKNLQRSDAQECVTDFEAYLKKKKGTE